MEMAERDILEELNPQQREAVVNIDGASLIVAGAGSGKTRVLTTRIAYMLDGGVPPFRIMALTFTKRAAEEMKERIAAMAGKRRARWIWMGTFHSVFIRFLKEYADRLGYPHSFTIYDQSDSRSAIRQCIRDLSLDEKVYKPSLVQNRISLAKNNLVTAARYRSDSDLQEADRSSRIPRVCDIYDLYQKRCKESGAMDFDDILLNTNILFRDHPDALEEIAARFSYILVDEYQDTNYSQYIILRRLADPHGNMHGNICVVGDDAQSIYGFRGARIENILRFQKDYPKCRVFKLEQNYRSTRTIVSAANSVIERNSNRLRKDCFSEGATGEKVRLINAFTELEEAYMTASDIVNLVFRDKARYSDFAILYRTNAQSRTFEEALRKKNLPYRIFGGNSFFDRAEVKDMLAYFKLSVNPRDDEALKRVINVPLRGIGATSMQHLMEAASRHGCSLFEAISLPGEELLACGLKGAALEKMRTFASLIAALNSLAASGDAFEVASSAGSSSGYLDFMRQDTSPEGRAKLENVEELFNSVKTYVEEEAEMRRTLAEDGDAPVDLRVSMGDYLDNIYLLSDAERSEAADADGQADEGDDGTPNKISLMTIHASKGKEFPYVFVVGMEENLFPSERGMASQQEIEEERRLFYVALTRAKRRVALTWAQNRMQWGNPTSNPVSRFVREIDSRYLDGDIPEERAVNPFAAAASGPRSQQGYAPSRQQGRAASPYASGQRSGSGGFASGPRYGSAGSVSGQGRTSAPRLPGSGQASGQTSGRAAAPREGFQPDPIASFRAGQRIEHDRFGFGLIESISGEGADMRAQVLFDDSGLKTLLLKFAKMRVAE